jgi:hypothetical protein
MITSAGEYITLLEATLILLIWIKSIVIYSIKAKRLFVFDLSLDFFKNQPQIYPSPFGYFAGTMSLIYTD